MDNEVVERMRGRIRQMHRLKIIAHDPRMIAIIEKVISEAEADIAKLEEAEDRDEKNK